jgi:hypothetical protein
MGILKIALTPRKLLFLAEIADHLDGDARTQLTVTYLDPF